MTRPSSSVGHGLEHRALASGLVRMARRSSAGTPLRHGRGVVVSSTIGSSVVTIDGGTSPASDITAVNYAHAQAFPVGTVVDLLHVAGKSYILGSYDNDVPIGGLVASKTNTLFNNTGTVFTLAVHVVAGHTYQVSLYAIGTQQTANSGITDVVLGVSAGTLSPGAFRAFSTAVNSGVEMSGTCMGLYTPASTGSVTFTVTVGTSAGTLLISAGNALLLVSRNA